MIDTFSSSAFERAPIMGVLRGVDWDTLKRILPLYEEAGFTTLEITMNTPKAEVLIHNAIQNFPNLNIGAGTVCNVQDLQKAIHAGANFIVTPILNEALFEKCKTSNTPIFPGAFTPSEIYRAWELGAKAVKVFPCSQMGPKYIKDIKAPLDEIPLLPMGGINQDNLFEYFKLGVYGVGMGGSALFTPQLMEEGKEKELLEHFKKLYSKLEQIKTILK
ncbi:bifunctional 4-hydroxy-2-oxoglutarate aldolase/2-dehydro-3-deoxy-phosphogluconate aldolase [Flammeovirga aprica]|uniref:Bifunctional 4-hydroxy-2-oxoglutarate aldolase/2-dehydro-3-deoxy-phosphogluconate aldolase n=1 Tax=Flammeovirga aprica JL-4 TaxID=694437 RepID=A0A7X9RVT6_9BACT|nr:bifunctional 4-hydroxy-2-oxoglutarate aldolase/2-dehydro-3-deoxy-phosphogluconate aldolase [Flammeovirga aprica]NME69622.1 bifunctional 4-hydroxy-2-oxoglutarate aldolase/2-dehydro-3-deoxy-phosphogluconate aldolase [Flammeovirga aprica JL-4]